jgi:hypothetical protein
LSRIKLPSPSMSISLLALFVALGGTGYAAVKINGKNIKAKTITGNKFKNNTITGNKFKSNTLTGSKLKTNTLTGKQIDESKLDTVPRAAVAATAGTANALTDAGKAGFLSSTNVGSSGLIKLPLAPSIAAAPRTTIIAKGPFSANARCFDDGTGKQTLKVGVASTEPGSDVNDVIGTVDDNFMTVTASAPGAFASDLDFATLSTPSGLTLVMTAHGGVNALGAACFISADSLSHP